MRRIVDGFAERGSKMGHSSRHWTAWIILALVVFNGGWMAFDGSRALVVGDYVTPGSGPHAGQLGPWSRIVEAVGIPPRSTPMKIVFVVYGLVYLAAAAAFLAGRRGARRATQLVALLGLWYLPWGTLIGVVVIALLQSRALRRSSAD